MAEKFTFTNTERTNIRAQLATTFLYTELSGVKADAYKFSFAGKGKSGYSFGLAQIDLGQESSGQKRNPGADNFLKSVGLTDDEITKLRSGSAAQELPKEFLKSVSPKLAANADKVDAYMADQLDAKVTRLENIINKVQETRPDVAQSIRNSDTVKLAILDYDNQLGVTGAARGERDGLLLRFLKGEAVINSKGVEGEIGNASPLAPGAGVSAEDILNFKKNQTEWGNKNQGKNDIARRENDFQRALQKLKVSEGVVDDVDTYAGQFDPNARVYVSMVEVTVDGRTYQVLDNDTLEANLPGGLRERRYSDGTGEIIDDQGKQVLALIADDRVSLWDDGRISIERENFGDGEVLGSDRTRIFNGAKENASWDTRTEHGSSTFDGSVRTDAVTNKVTNATTISATDEATGQTQSVAVRPVAMTEKQYNDQMYSSMAGFLNALRGNDKLGMALNGAKMVVDTAIYNNKGEVPGNVLIGANKTMAGISATIGIVAGLHALQSNDLQTQLNGVVGLLYSANSLAGIMGVTHDVAVGKTANGFLSEGNLLMLQQAGALLSIANLRNLDKMLENGQVGSAVSTVLSAVNGIGILTQSSSLTFMTPQVALALVVASFVLDSMFSKKPPPPPPVGWAEFIHNPQGLQYLYHGTTPSGQDMPGDKAMGNRILQSAMDKVLTSLNKQLTDANANITDPSRALVTIASRLPKVFIQSWLSKEGNGETNYYYYLEMTHPQTGQKYGAQVARQDIVKEYAGLSMAPEAIVQQWQAAHLAAKFGADESKWQTEFERRGCPLVLRQRKRRQPRASLARS
jgi:hypothetical protein